MGWTPWSPPVPRQLPASQRVRPGAPRLCVDTAAERREATGPGAHGLARATFCLAGGRQRLGAQPRLPPSSPTRTPAPRGAGPGCSVGKARRNHSSEQVAGSPGRLARHSTHGARLSTHTSGKAPSPPLTSPQRKDSSALAPVTGGWGATGPGPPTRRPRSGARPLSAPGPGPWRPLEG